MSAASPPTGPVQIRGIAGSVLLVLALAVGALIASVFSLSLLLPSACPLQAVFRPDLQDIHQVVVYYSWLPRLIMSILSGAGLGLAGAVFQQVLRNSLADPTTLGVSAGAQLALSLVTLFAPSLLALGTASVALAGAGLAAALVAFLAWHSTLSPSGLILGGLMVSLYAGAFGTVLALLFGDDLGGVFIWSTGSLSQNDWSGVTYLLPRISGAGMLIAIVARPLSALTLEDRSARSLGLHLGTIRLLAMAPAVAISAFVVSTVGVLGFIGLAAPTLARLSGARRFRDQLIWAPLLGAALLWLTDQFVQLIAAAGWSVPTGTATAMLGAPLLLWLLPRTDVEFPAKSNPVSRASRPLFVVIIGLIALVALLWPALDLARDFNGWRLDPWSELQPLLSLRAPRIIAAASAGAMLAVAGALMQRLTGNGMASPEVLGISSGASLAVLLVLLITPWTGNAVFFVVASIGAFVTLFAMLALGHRSAFSPQRMLLTGIALGTCVNAITSFLMASGDPGLGSAISWLSGSTYRVDVAQAFFVGTISCITILAVPFVSRWLEILPLGEAPSKAMGVNLRSSRLALLLLAAALTGTATLVVGPLSFVGLMAPHMARMLGLHRPFLQLSGSAILGALIMLIADWLGRNLLFPLQIPAGLLATFIGGPYFFALMRRSAA
ncbi:MAG: Fe(3+)-hydroxamate ABC transporter permease FhuB [Rhizobium sp.]|nr:MAG: Fe(3+)-hydroxamate ABC transporter permease FhuB [Rhizobium sp.]